MKDKQSAFDNVMQKGNEICILLGSRSLDMDMLADSVKAADEEIEKAALAGDESAYAEAKRKRTEAQNRLEMLQIQAKNNAPVVDLDEAKAVLNSYAVDNSDRMKEAFRTFLSQFDAMSKTIDSIVEIGKEYNKVMDYWKNFVLKTPNFPYREFAALIYPIKIVMDIKQRFSYQREQVERLINGC